MTTLIQNIKNGDRFELRGVEYRAKSDARVARTSVYIDSVSRKGQMPSGWECADTMEPVDTEVTLLCVEA